MYINIYININIYIYIKGFYIHKNKSQEIIKFY